MTLKDYIQSNKKGKEANRLERDAISDPFLQEALDGFDSVAGNHAEIIDNLEQRFSNIADNRKKNRGIFFYASIAASLALLIGLSVYFFMDVKNEARYVAMAEEGEGAKGRKGEGTKGRKGEGTKGEREKGERDLVVMEEQLELNKELEVVAEEKTIRIYFPDVVFEVMEEEATDIYVYMDYLVDEMIAISDEKNESFADKKEETLAYLEIEEKEVQMELLESRNLPAAKAKDQRVSITFGEKEFAEYCRNKASKKTCAGKGAKVEVVFFINNTGKPSNFQYISISCEEAKKEMKKLLDSSPVWTDRNREVRMVVEW